METDRVVPVVIFLRQARGVRQRLSGDRHTYLDFHYLRCALGELSYEHYRHSDNLVARLNLPNMRYPAGNKAEVYAQAVQGLTGLEPDPEKQLKYLDFIDIYAALDDNERVEYQRDYPDEAKTIEPICRTLPRGGHTARYPAGHATGCAAGLTSRRGLSTGAIAPAEIRRLTRRGTATDRAGPRADPAHLVRTGPDRQPSR